MSSFVFTVNTSVYNANISYICPIINTDSTFADLASSIVDNDSTTSITWSWSAFNDNGTTNDGLKISQNSNFALNVASLNITAFGQVPLSRNSVSGFQSFSGQNSASDVPTILSNTNFSFLFGSVSIPSANFGNLNSWDVSNVTNMNQMFYYCTNFNQNINSWNVSNVTNMNEMFNNCNNFNQNINPWNVSNVTNMNSMFNSCTNFNQPLNLWTVTAVTNMNSMFYLCTRFNQNINNWIMPNVTNMNSMFNGCFRFNQPLNGWTISAVTNMGSMFTSCYMFNQDISEWNVSTVTNMSNMFQYCSSFNQPLNSWNVSNVTNMGNMFNSCTNFNQDISSWNTAKVDTMNYMFQNCNQFNQPLNNWNVSNVYEISYMFKGCFNFNQPLNLWNTIKVTNMGQMFYRCTQFNQDISGWNVSIVTSMNGMFKDCSNFNQPLNSWIVSNVTDMGNMFNNCVKFNQPLNSWNVSKVTTMRQLFDGCTIFNQDISSWDVSHVTDMGWLFFNCTNFNQDLGSWNIVNVGYMANMFNHCNQFNQASIGSWNFSNIDYWIGLFINQTGFTPAQYGQFLINLSNNTTLKNDLNIQIGCMRYNTQAVSDAFTYLTNPVGSGGKNMTIEDSVIDSSVITPQFVFTVSTSSYNSNLSYTCPIINTDGTFTDLTSTVINNGNGFTTIHWTWTVFNDNGTTMDGLKLNNNPNFNLYNSSLIISSFGSVPLSRNSSSSFQSFSGSIIAGDAPTILSNTDFSQLFQSSNALSYGKLNLWDVSGVVNMQQMFYAVGAPSENISDWNVSNVTNMSYMFMYGNMGGINSPLNTWDVSKVTNMDNMFNGCNEFGMNQDISNWNVSNVTNMSNMFNSCTYLTSSLNAWNTSAVTNMSYMFNGCTRFNQPLDLWNTSNVTNMSYMFRYMSFNQDINSWDVAKVVNMNNMFLMNTLFNQPLNSWIVSSVTDMGSMFTNCSSFNQPINAWDVSKVTYMNSMFQECYSFNQPLNLWTTTNVSNMSSMFYGCSSFNNSAIGLWNFTYVTNITDMITYCGFNPTQYGLFLINLSNNTTIPNNLNLGTNILIRYDNILTNNAYIQLTNSVVNGGKNMGIVDSGVPIPFKIIVSTSTYNSNLTYIYPIINTDLAFTNLSHTVIDNGDGTTTFDWIWDSFTDNGTTNDGLKITNNSNFTLNDDSLNITIFGSVKLSRDSSGGFSGFTGQISATDMPTILSNTNFTNLFTNTHIPTEQFGNISNWSVSNVTNMDHMFSQCTNFDQDISGWTVSNVTNMDHMFSQCTNFNQVISGWTVTNVTNMSNMFANATNFNQSIGSWDFTNVSNITDMIESTAYNFAQYSNFLVDLSNNLTLPNNLNLGTTNLSRNGDIITSRAFTQLTNPVISGGKNMQILDSIACFLEGTLIQCLDKNTKQAAVYKPIQDLIQGDLIKTYKHGYVPLNMIGCSKIFNPGNNERITNRLYKCSANQYPRLFEDLIITGCHSILVNDFKPDEREKTKKVLKKIYITDDKYRLPACVDNNTEPYEKQGIFTIYHIALDNPDYYMNYGVYANGLLVETCSRRYLTELANMQIITDSYNLQ